MTRITTFQVAGILALMCFSEVCYAYNKTTTGPTTTTEATTNGPKTSAASSMTTKTGNMTTTEATTTAEPMTTTVRKMTTTGPTTITESNMATAVSNMTKESNTTSTIPLVTSEAPWKVNDKDGKLCMLMDFDGTITDVNTNVTEPIPYHASSSTSDCNSSSFSAFVLNFNTPFTEWEIVLNFTTRGGSFELHTLSVNRTTLRTPLSSSETTDFFHVPLGDYYTCSHFNYKLQYFQVNLTNPLLQPFVKETEGGDNFGQPYVCRPAQQSGSLTMKLNRKTQIGLWVGISLVLLIIVALNIYCGCCSCNCTGCSSCCN